MSRLESSSAPGIGPIRHKSSFWDAMIVAAAERTRCRFLLSEDLPDRPRIRLHHDRESLRNISPGSISMPDRFDVIIAGGGVIGASIAWRLARNHLRVLLLDAAKIGSEASSAAAGMLTPGGEFDQPSPLLDFAIGSLAQYDDFVDAHPSRQRPSRRVPPHRRRPDRLHRRRTRIAYPARRFPTDRGHSLHRLSSRRTPRACSPGPPRRHRRHPLHQRSHRRSRAA